ncbi:MAG TPA: CBS domain-containing protein [Actinophytocola sp.]|jgi:CBS domain-containing protein|uniref:CBS domain-containing protein n=1 Tax=Actinophytocola sp. TaxID=1872138 RepID=UPI002F941184
MDTSTLDNLPIQRVMSAEVLGIVPSAPLEVALRMMVEAGVRHLPVVERRRCLGLLHESDALWRLWSTTGAGTRPCRTVMRTPPPCVDAAGTVGMAARRMARSASDAVLVLDEGRVVGIVTATDLVDLLAKKVTQMFS